MKRGLSPFTRSVVLPLVLWIPLLAALTPALQSQPLTSRNEDGLLLAIVVLLAVLQVTWKRLAVLLRVRLLPPALWVFLFLMSVRAVSPAGMYHYGWFSTIFFVGTLLVLPRSEEKARKLRSPALVVLTLGVFFLLAADLVLVIIQPSAIPIVIPAFWLERIGFLWPLLFCAATTLLLSADLRTVRCVLGILLALYAGLAVKEQRWSRRIELSLARGEAALSEGRLEEARQRLADARWWNQRKRIAGIDPDVRRLRAQLYRRQGRPLGALFEVKQAIQAAPERAGEFLQLAGPDALEYAARIPLTRLNDLGLMVDLEPGPNPKTFFLLDRWGRVFLHTDSGIEFAFDAVREPQVGSEPADLEIVGEGAGAIVMNKRGEFFFYGEVPTALRELLASARVPAQTYVDFELTPQARGAYLLSDRGSVIAVGSVEVEIADEERIQWPYSIARDLEVAPDGLGLYLMDGYGKVHTFGRTPIDTSGDAQPYWLSDQAVDIESLPSGEGFYLLTRFGGVYVVGDPVVRERFEIPEEIQPLREWSYAVALQLSDEGQNLAILENNGGLTRIVRHPKDPEVQLERMRRQVREGQFYEAVDTAEALLKVAPETQAAVLDLFNATFCRRLAAEAPCSLPKLWVAVDVEQLEGGRRALVLDRWGRLWEHDGERLTPVKLDTRYDARTGRATDLEWIPSAQAAVILYDDGTLEPWGALPATVRSLLDSYKAKGSGWIDLEPTADWSGFVLANVYGGFRKVGQVPIVLPKVGDFQWRDVPIGRDIEIGSAADSLYFLDGHGVTHPFGNTRFFTKGKEAPYWSTDRGRGLVLAEDEGGAYVLDHYGLCHPIGDVTAPLQACGADLMSASDFVDFERSPDGAFYTFLERNFRVTTVVVGARSGPYYAKRLRRLDNQGRVFDALVELDTALTVSSGDVSQRQIAAALPPEWMLSLAERLSRAPASPEQRRLMRDFFEKRRGPFVDLEPSASGEEACLLDGLGRLYHCRPEAFSGGVVFDVLDSEPISGLNRARAVDLEILEEAPGVFIVLDSSGRTHCRGSESPPQAIVRLLRRINADPSANAIDLEFTSDRRGAVVMDRQGYLKTYGVVPLPDYELDRMGWEGYEIARDIELTPDGRGLYLLDGLGAVHALAETTVPTRPGELEVYPWLGRDVASAITTPDERGFWMLDAMGGLHTWAEAPFDTPPTVWPLGFWSRGERMVDAEWAGGNRLFVLSNWGRVEILQSGPEGAAFHRRRVESAGTPLERLQHLHRAVAADEALAPQALASVDPRWFFDLLPLLGDLPEDFWIGLEEQPKTKDQFEILTDIKPGPAKDQADVLDRWGRVHRWDAARRVVLKSPRDALVPEPASAKAVAFVERPGAGDSNPSFIVADLSGRLHVSGRWPEALEEGVADTRLDLYDVADLALSPDARSVFVLDSLGKVRFVGRSTFPEGQLSGVLWDYPIARSLALAPDGRGLYLLDGNGVIHCFGQTSLDVKAMSGPWFAGDEARRLRLDFSSEGFYLADRDGRVYKLGSPEAQVPDSALPRLAAATGEQLIRMEADRIHSRLWLLSNRNRVVCIPVGEQAAKEYHAQAMAELASGRALEACTWIEKAVALVPDGIARRLEDFSPNLVEHLLRFPEWEYPEVDIWMDLELRPGKREVWILNRWGEIYSGVPGELSRRRIKPATRSARAVDMITGATSGRALILYEDGIVEAWGGSFGDLLQRALAEYNRSPVMHAIDLEWAAGEQGFYITSNRGPVTAVGQQRVDLGLTRGWIWGEDEMAATLKATPDGRALLLFDRLGGVHEAGQSGIDLTRRNAPYFKQPGLAVDIELAPGGRPGLYYLDALGALHTIGEPGALPRRGSLPYFTLPSLVDFELADGGRVVVLTCNGRLYESKIAPGSE